ncbi:MAG: antitoxin [Anaerolineae bacterium]|nr:antitoxin [Anaerolineae bacterium]
MNEPHAALADRIRNEMEDLDRAANRAMSSWIQGQTTAVAQDVYLESVALNLHGFYSGLERLFELIARQVDHSLPDGEMWHRDLLLQMASEQNVRPAVMSQSMIPVLDELRRFRHLVRNVYTFNLSPEKMKGLLDVLPGAWTNLKTELLAFADFLDALAGEERFDGS